MPTFSFQQVDVFTDKPLKGNPLAVVIGADGLADETMAVARQLDQPERDDVPAEADGPAADYRVRIFTPERELPFAGHPTLGSCQVWLNSGGRAEAVAHRAGMRRRPDRGSGATATASPSPHRRFAAAATSTRDTLRTDRDRASHRAGRDQGVAMVDNGPGWVAVMLAAAPTCWR